jgi:hypothetical protein
MAFLESRQRSSPALIGNMAAVQPKVHPSLQAGALALAHVKLRRHSIEASKAIAPSLMPMTMVLLANPTHGERNYRVWESCSATFANKPAIFGAS